VNIFNGPVRVELMTIPIRVWSGFQNPTISRAITIAQDRYHDNINRVDLFGVCQRRADHYQQVIYDLRRLLSLTNVEIYDLMTGMTLVHSGHTHVDRELTEAAILDLEVGGHHLREFDMCKWRMPREGGPVGRHDLRREGHVVTNRHTNPNYVSAHISSLIGLTDHGLGMLNVSAARDSMIWALRIGASTPLLNMVLEPEFARRWGKIGRSGILDI
jgi:hypothetical protein